MRAAERSQDSGSRLLASVGTDQGASGLAESRPLFIFSPKCSCMGSGSYHHSRLILRPIHVPSVLPLDDQPGRVSMPASFRSLSHASGSAGLQEEPLQCLQPPSHSLQKPVRTSLKKRPETSSSLLTFWLRGTGVQGSKSRLASKNQGKVSDGCQLGWKHPESTGVWAPAHMACKFAWSTSVGAEAVRDSTRPRSPSGTGNLHRIVLVGTSLSLPGSY